MKISKGDVVFTPSDRYSSAALFNYTISDGKRAVITILAS
ncbi:cadherin-like domain-containing protein [Rhizobium sp. P32RR-XVIII]|nr:hypothetical protein [Rhizobium sp. P32RR-XVIII]